MRDPGNEVDFPVVKRLFPNFRTCLTVLVNRKKLKPITAFVQPLSFNNLR